MRQQQTEVLVVGAGPVGMFTALLLARDGVKVQLIDQAPEVADQSYACGLHGRSVKALGDAGLAAELTEYGRRIDSLVIHPEHGGKAEIDFSEVTPWFPHLLTIPQTRLEQTLEQKLNDAGVRVNWHHRLADLRTGNGLNAIATVEQLTGTATGYDVPRWETVVNRTFTTSAEFVIGADGAHSVVRRLLGIDVEPFAKPQLFVVYEFESDTAHEEMHLVLGKQHRNVFWPLPGGHCRWGFEWTDTAPDGEFPAKHRGGMWYEDQAIAERTRQHLQQLLQARAPWFRGSIDEITWASDVQFEPFLARQCGRGRCWLVGDAAHQTGPIGVQSMNVGFREGEALAHAISLVLRGRASAAVLEEHERRCRQEWLSLLGATSDVTAEGPQQQQPRIPAGTGILSCLPGTGKELHAMLAALGLRWSERMPEPVLTPRAA